MKPLYIIIHHTASSRDKTTVAKVDSWHKVRWPGFKSSLGYYVGYQKITEGDGKITQTRSNNEEGAHTLGYNRNSIGSALVGNFDIEKPNKEQLDSLGGDLEKLKKEYNIPNSRILGHGQVSNTSCPGKELSKWLNLYKQLNILQRILELLKQLFKGRLK